MINQNIASLIDKLTSIYLSKGIQPSDLVDNIFLDTYLEVITKRTKNGIEAIISYSVECEDDISKVYIHKFKYTYNLEKYLIRIEQAINSKNFKITWDRNNSIDNIINELIINLKNNNLSDEAIESILNTLPKDLRKTSIKKLKLVA